MMADYSGYILKTASESMNYVEKKALFLDIILFMS